MENGMAIIEVTDTATTGFFIDEERLEFARMNAAAKKHRAAQEKAAQAEERNRRRAAKAAAQRRAYNIRTFAYVASRFAVCGGVAVGGTVGMIHPAIYIPVALLCLATACLRLGTWFGRNIK